MSKTIAIIQARMGSTRFPGKVMKDLAGKPVLEWVVEAAVRAQGVDMVVVATSKLKQDDIIVKWCDRNRYHVFRGDEHDVLDRFYQCAKKHNGTVLIRLTADCPFLDYNVISDVVSLRKMTDAAYASNIDPPTYPDGLDVECFTFAALEAAWTEATRASDRDCVPQYIVRNRDRFPAVNLTCPLPELAKERWVLDTQEDYVFCQALGKLMRLHSKTYQNILGVLKRNPKLRDINKMWTRNERFYEQVSTENLPHRSFHRSDHHLTRALRTIPFGSQTFSKSHIQFPASQAPLYVTHADGCRIFDVDGNDYIDMVSAIMPVILGYRDPDVDLAIRRQLDKGIIFSLATKEEAELAELLCHHIPCAESVKFGKSGTDVTTAAIRLARAYTGRDHILVGGYHGWADWSMACSNRDAGIPTRVKMMSKPLSSYDQSYPEHLAAIIVEPNDNPEKLKELREYCTKHGIVLIFDEIITGFRYHMGGAQKLFDVLPDLACFGKAMGNGMPISAVVGRREIMRLMQPPNNIFYSGTMFGESLSIAAAIATIQKLDRTRAIRDIWERGDLLAEEVSAIIYHNELRDAIQIKGFGPRKMLTFHDHDGATKDQIRTLFMIEMAQQGVLIINSHNIMLAHDQPAMKRVIIAYVRTLNRIKETLQRGDIEKIVGNHIVAEAPLRAAS